MEDAIMRSSQDSSEATKVKDVRRASVPLQECSRNQKRTETRQLSHVGKSVWKSLQNCRIGENLDVINSFIKQYTNNQTHSELLFHLQGLKAILEILLADIPHGNRTVRLSFMTFDEGFSLFASYNLKSSIMQLSSKDGRKRFKELLCHPRYGLCIREPL